MSKKVYLITGPTASGKTDRSIELALQLGSPIVSADSRQLYREMKIGTAPPSPEQLELVRHYFIHSHTIFESITAGRYEQEAVELLKELFKEFDDVVVVGGSGLYIDALCYGIDHFPPSDPRLRSELTARVESEGVQSLRMELKRLDPKSYYEIDLANPQRVVRALEVTLQTGKPFSSFKSGSIKERFFEIEKINIEMERELLYERIDRRVDLMVEAGLVEEAHSLFKWRELPPLKSVGYREFFDHFEGLHSLERAVELVKRNSRRYAKRQITWFKKNP